MTEDRHERVATLLREHGPFAPPQLRARVEAEIARANRRRLPRPVHGLRPTLATAGATLAIAAALALPLLAGDGNPSAIDIHGLSADGPTAAAPPAASGSPQLLAERFEGVDFPRWEPEFGWRAYGERRDQIDGRDTTTVFYEHEGHTLAYTVVSGAPLEIPGDAERRRVNGVDLALLRDDHGHEIAVFERQGRTCVVSGHLEHRSTLIELASWAGDGRVDF